MILDYDIKKDMSTTYSMDLRVQDGNWVTVDGKHISHENLCKYNGMLQIGQVTQAFDCSCKDGKGCQMCQSIEIRVKQEDR